jgi:hypothetical protein
MVLITTLRRAEGGAKIFGVFRVKNHDFTPKNHIFPILGGGARNFWGISCEKSRRQPSCHMTKPSTILKE